MTTAKIQEDVDAFWAAYFGCTLEDLHGDRAQVYTHVALEAYDGALIFRHGNAVIASVPEQTPEIEREKIRNAKPDEAFDPKFIAKTFVVSMERVTGPAWVGFADSSDFKPGDEQGARLLGKGDAAAIRGLAEGCGEATWKQSKLAEDRPNNFGLFVGDDLVAASGYIVMGEQLAYIGVVTHPEKRGKGLARAVVTASMKHAFEAGLVAMWRTTHANKSAVRLATSLGFQHYASTYDIQLTEDRF